MIQTSVPLKEMIQNEEYAGYAYSYPHKLAYRPFSEPVSLNQMWSEEPKDSLFLYFHIPFCEMRCGFCNLFTTVRPKEELVERTMKAIFDQSQIVRNQVAPNQVKHLAIGGGTPSFLSEKQLESLFYHIGENWPIEFLSLDSSVETSPATISDEKLRIFKSFSVKRISMGVQSFQKQTLQSLGRPQGISETVRSIEKIQAWDFPIFNLDLIYGAEGQSISDWMTTVRKTASFRPEEIYLYPLYVREKTGLGKTGRSVGEIRRQMYWEAKDFLEAEGYGQESMRLFRLKSVESSGEYSCQRNGMIGLGPGARSYTKQWHYSSEYAVGQKSIAQIIESFNRQGTDDFEMVDFGFRLDLEEQKRRFVIKSLLKTSGISKGDYEDTFGKSVEEDFPCLKELNDLNLQTSDQERVQLNHEGISWSDVIGPWLYSDRVKELCRLYQGS